jgi:GNAT superfamily N-acetyltransferase
MRPDTTFEFATSAKDYVDVLQLILRANQNEGRFAGLTSEDMASPLDAYSRFITCRVGPRIVGCVRVTAVDGERWKSLCAFAGHVIPEWLWNAGFVEAHSLAIDPAFQGAGLLVPMTTRMACLAYAWGRNYLLIGTAIDLLSFYRHVGFLELERREVTPRPGWTFTSALLTMDLPELVHNPPRGRWTLEVAEALARIESELLERASPVRGAQCTNDRGLASVPSLGSPTGDGERRRERSGPHWAEPQHEERNLVG